MKSENIVEILSSQIMATENIIYHKFIFGVPIRVERRSMSNFFLSMGLTQDTAY